ncbi:class I SAM-dependent methyltransferase [Actinoplanes sp. NPDC051475]|uniref:class I SAM-dependent methyltransferase n=1 Tax=Actinoplanes sp. NPDC051475 TaxID=3157225 RepID=UPI003450E1C6
MTDYRDVNRANWDERAPAHAASAGYDVAAFARDPRHLSDVVTFDRPLLGDIDGLRGIHLQCHIGTDTVSLARLGATMTGLDFSPASLAEARRLAAISGTPVGFVESDEHTTTHSWNHGLGEIVTALLEAGMTITGLVEHDTVPWEALPGTMTRVPGGEWQVKDRPRRLPHTYTLQAVRTAV